MEIKKKKLKKIFGENVDIKIVNLDIKIFNEIWEYEMNKILKFDYEKAKKVNKKDDVCRRLNLLYKPAKASILYAFYLQMLVDGYIKTRDLTRKSTFYRKVGELKASGIDFTQADIEIVENVNFVDFDPFNCKCEVI